MEWVDGLRDTVVALDTAPLIYFIEDTPSTSHAWGRERIDSP